MKFVNYFRRKIDEDISRKVWNKLNDIGISHLELQFAVVIGRTDIRGK